MSKRSASRELRADHAMRQRICLRIFQVLLPGGRVRREGVPGIVIARDAGLQPEAIAPAIIIRLGDEAHVQRIEFAPADEEFLVAPLRRQQHLIERGHRAVVQVRRRRPHAFERPWLVARDFLRQIQCAETLQALLRRVVDAVVGVEAVLDEQADEVERLSFAELASRRAGRACGRCSPCHGAGPTAAASGGISRRNSGSPPASCRARGPAAGARRPVASAALDFAERSVGNCRGSGIRVRVRGCRRGQRLRRLRPRAGAPVRARGSAHRGSTIASCSGRNVSASSAFVRPVRDRS